MKKIIAVLIVLAMMLGTLSGCGKKNTTPNNPGTGGNQSGTNQQNDPPKDEIKGTELSTFMGDYMDAKSKAWDAMSKKFDEDQNLTFAMAALGFTFVDLSLVEIMMFDAISVLNGTTYKGKLGLSNIDGWKKVNGNIIEFGYDYTYTEDKDKYLKGDHDVAVGAYDRKNETLTYEHYTERGGKKIFRFVTEVVKNSNKSYSSQIFFIGDSDKNGDGDLSLGSYLAWFDGEDISCIMTENKENDTIDFKYSSILNKKNIKPEDMVNGMKVVFKASFIGGKATFEQAEE